jgi:hypothetical protein
MSTEAYGADIAARKDVVAAAPRRIRPLSGLTLAVCESAKANRPLTRLLGRLKLTLKSKYQLRPSFSGGDADVRIDELRIYTSWVGKSALEVRQAVQMQGGWAVVFPTDVPR